MSAFHTGCAGCQSCIECMLEEQYGPVWWVALDPGPQGEGEGT